MVCAWHNDQAQVILEIANEESKATTDADRCSLRDLLDELSEEVGEFSINNHTFEKPSTVKDQPQGAETNVLCRFRCHIPTTKIGFNVYFFGSGEPAYLIKPKPQQIFFSWSTPTNMNGVKFASAASLFTTDAAWILWCLFRSVKHQTRRSQNCGSQAIETSKTLLRAWRVFFQKESKEACV